MTSSQPSHVIYSWFLFFFPRSARLILLEVKYGVLLEIAFFFSPNTFLEVEKHEVFRRKI
jgi:hypothetical protein